MNLSQAAIQLITYTQPEVIEQELVQDGTGLNYRPLVLKYSNAEIEVLQTFIYKYPTNSAEWMAASSTYIEKEVSNG